MKKILSRLLWRLFPEAMLHRRQREKHGRLSGKQLQHVFEEIHSQNLWAGSESVSGQGSSLEETRSVREALMRMVSTHGIRTVADIPCGDFHWMREVAHHFDQYIGGDVVEPLVEANNARHTMPNVRFMRIDLTCDPLPAADLLIVRDCLVHLSYAHAQAALANIARSNYQWVLMTHFPGASNRDVLTGDWRPLDMCGAPFHLPPPAEVMADGSASQGKFLGLWRHADLTIDRGA